MAITIRTNRINVFKRSTKPKMYLLYIVYDKHISWDFCMRILMNIFHKNIEDAHNIANDILTNGEGLCGVFHFEIAETKAETVEEQAKKEGFSLQCYIEEV